MTTEQKLSVSSLIAFCVGLTLLILVSHAQQTEGFYWLYPIGSLTSILIILAANVWAGVNFILLWRFSRDTITRRLLWLLVAIFPILVTLVHFYVTGD